MPVSATLPRDPGPARATFPCFYETQRRGRSLRWRKEGEGSGPDQGSKAGDHHEARPHRGRHRLAAGADRDAHAANQRADRASAHPQARPLLAARAAQARRAAPPLLELPAEARPRGLPRPHQGARPAPLAPNYTEGGSSSEPAFAGSVAGEAADAQRKSWHGLARAPALHKQSGGQLMSIATERRAQVSVQIGDHEISFETGHLAKQADGAVVVRGGDTMVLATAQGRAEAREGADFFPLTVDVEERMYAAGKIPGGFIKREGRPTEHSILASRLVDRPIRPLFPKGYRNDVQVVVTVLSVDQENDSDILGVVAASAALSISDIPFSGPVGAVTVGYIGGKVVINPTLDDMKVSDLDLSLAGTSDAVVMVEAGANELPEE